MERRRFLAGAGLTAVSALAGCLGQSDFHYPETPAAPDAVADWTFETREPDDGDPEPESKPSVTCSAGDGEVRIEGVMYSGNRCDAIAPASIESGGGEFVFTLAVFDVQSGPCGDVLVATHYEATFTFSDALPGRIVAVESIDEAYGETRRRSVDCDTM